MKLLQSVKQDVRTDVNWNRAARLSVRGVRALPSASAQYAIDKFPIIGWLPRYDYRWIISDVIAGLTLGLMLIPQSLSYAKIATIPVQYGLMSSWLPASIYAFMGTSKDLSTGPTSLIGLLTSETIDALKDEPYTPSQIASAVATIMGIYGMVLGFLKLGFLLDFISLPVLSGFISAVAITIILNQMDSLLGEENVGDGAATQIHDIFAQLPEANGYTCAIGFTGILFLVILEQAGKRWGNKNKIIWFLSVTRAFLTLVLFTGISYAVNKNRTSDTYLFDIVKVKSSGIEHPKFPDGGLIGKVAGRSVAVFVGAAIEHTAIARAFGVRNNYTTDQSQELCYFGITNFFNSFFHSMGVGGAMSRTAVNSACKVKSPLSGFVTTAVVLVCIYELVGTLYWIPKATLAAIIITAVWPLISSPVTFYKYWKTSLSDFVASMIALWVTLFVSSEIGIASSVGFNIAYYLLRQVFVRVKSIGADDPRSELSISIDEARTMPSTMPADARIFKPTESFFFPNSFSIKCKIMDVIQTHHAPAYSTANGAEAERNWSVVGEQRVTRLRKKAHIHDPRSLPPLRLLVIDFGRVNHIDTTAVTHMRNLANEVRKYAGKEAEIRFAAMSEYVRERFERAGWALVDGDSLNAEKSEDSNALYRTAAAAMCTPRRYEAETHFVVGKLDSETDEKATYAHQEDA